MSLAGNIRISWAFLKRDLAIELTYRAWFLMQVGQVLFAVIFFAIISRLVGEHSSPYLQAYGGAYLPFAIVGIAFAGFMNNGLTCFGDTLREAQLAGTLEATLMTPVSLPALVLSSGLWMHVQTTLRGLGYLGMGVLLGMNLQGANLPGAILTFILGILAFDGLGIIGAAVVMVTKRGLPMMALFSAGVSLFSGVFFPVNLLPPQVQWLAALLPSTYALEGLRLALLSGAGMQALLPHLVPLALFDLVMVPLSLFIFHRATKRAMVNGSLVHY